MREIFIYFQRSTGKNYNTLKEQSEEMHRNLKVKKTVAHVLANNKKMDFNSTNQKWKN